MKIYITTAVIILYSNALAMDNTANNSITKNRARNDISTNYFKLIRQASGYREKSNAVFAKQTPQDLDNFCTNIIDTHEKTLFIRNKKVTPATFLRNSLRWTCFKKFQAKL